VTTYLLVLILLVAFAIIVSFFVWVGETLAQGSMWDFIIGWAVTLVVIVGAFMLGVCHAKSTPIKWSQDIKEPNP